MSFRLWAVGLILSFAPSSCFAVLGQAPSPGGRSLVMQAPVSKQNLSVQQTVISATTVREYLDETGNVFAISWEGNKDPDLGPFLGSYYSEYSIATASTLMRQPRRSLAAVSDHLEVHRFGHMGDLHGIVLLPARVPKGVQWTDLQ